MGISKNQNLNEDRWLSFLEYKAVSMLAVINKNKNVDIKFSSHDAFLE